MKFSFSYLYQHLFCHVQILAKDVLLINLIFTVIFILIVIEQTKQEKNEPTERYHTYSFENSVFSLFNMKAQVV